VFIFYDLRLARESREPGHVLWSWQSERLLRLAKLAAPVGIVSALGALNVNIPRYFLERYRGAGELGIFAALAYAVVVFGLVVNALGQSAVVRLSRNFAENRMGEYVGLIKRMSLIGVGVAAAGMALALVFGRTALRLAYGQIYANCLGLLLLFILTSGVNAVGSFLSYGMTAARRFKAQLPVFGATLASCGLASWILIPRWGMYGAAGALIVSALTQMIGSFTVVAWAVRHPRSTHSITKTNDSVFRNETLVCELEVRP